MLLSRPNLQSGWAHFGSCVAWLVRKTGFARLTPFVAKQRSVPASFVSTATINRLPLVRPPGRKPVSRFRDPFFLAAVIKPVSIAFGIDLSAQVNQRAGQRERALGGRSRAASDEASGTFFG